MRCSVVLRLTLAALLGVCAPGCGDDGGGDDEMPGDGDGDSGAAGEGGDSGVAGQGGSGGRDLPDIGGDIGDPEDAAAWTVFVYGHADHNLSNSFVRDVLEMAEADIADNVRVIVLADFDASQQSADDGETFPTGALWLRVTGGGDEPETLGEEDELDLDDPNVLASSIASVFAQFPSERRAVILWDHGGSWMGGFGGDTQDGQRQGSPMSAPVLAQAIGAGLAAAEVERLDILSFDTCLMASAEVALELHALADVYIANAELDYGDGWDYSAFLSYLSDNSGAPLQDIASTEVDQWDAHHANASPNDTLLRSHVALDATALPQLATAVNDFVVAWSSSEMLSGTELGRASYFTLPPYMNQLENAAAEPELRDLGQFLTKMSGVSDEAVANAAIAARDALDDAIIGRSQGELREAATQSGVHVELPLATRLSNDLLGAYEELAPAWVEASAWRDALAIYRALDDQGAPSLTTSITNGEDPDAEHLPLIAFDSAEPDVAEVDVTLGVVDPSDGDTLVVFGLIAKGPIESGFQYAVEWDGQLTTLPDDELGGVQAISVQTWEAVDAESATGASLPPVLATFGVVKTSDGTEALGALLFQDSAAETHLLTLLDPPVTLPLADVARDLPGTTFTPLYPTVSISTQQESTVAGSAIALDTDSLPLSRAPAAAGTYALLAGVSDVFGNVGGDAQLVSLSQPIE